MHDCEVSVQTSIGEDFQGVLAALFALAGAVLRKGGALVTWLPFTQDWLGSAAEGEPTNILVNAPPSCVQMYATFTAAQENWQRWTCLDSSRETL